MAVIAVNYSLCSDETSAELANSYVRYSGAMKLLHPPLDEDWKFSISFAGSPPLTPRCWSVARRTLPRHKNGTLARLEKITAEFNKAVSSEKEYSSEKEHSRPGLRLCWSFISCALRVRLVARQRWLNEQTPAVTSALGTASRPADPVGELGPTLSAACAVLFALRDLAHSTPRATRGQAVANHHAVARVNPLTTIREVLDAA